MRVYLLSLQAVLVTVVIAARGDAQGPKLEAALTATQDLAREVGGLQQSFATIPGPPQGRGLYRQADTIQMDIANLSELLGRKVKRDAVYTTYAQVDSKLNKLLDDLQGISTWDPAVRMAARRARAAQQELHFVLAGGDTTPTRQAEVVYGQTLLLQSRAEDLEGLVRFSLNQQEPLKGWTADFKNLHKGIAALQRAQQGKAARDAVKKQLLETDQAWNRLVVRYREMPQGQYPFVRHAFAQVDRVLGRLATLLGVSDRRAPLKDNFSS